jgi:hypothetical protein
MKPRSRSRAGGHGFDTRVAWVHDLFERIDLDSREERAVAV